MKSNGNKCKSTDRMLMIKFVRITFKKTKKLLRV